MSMKGLSHLPGILFLWLPFSCIACVSPSVRWSAIQWNLKNSLQPSTQVPSNALALASRPHHELHSLMKTCPAPTEQDLLGRWQGVNKGYAAACLGIHQDVKFFEVRRGQTSGFNILVKQVTLKELTTQGWQPQIERSSGAPRTMGNFVVSHRSATSSSDHDRLVLDYTQSGNAPFDPSRFLIDELVLIEPGLMLGRVRVKLGSIEWPIAYFALSRQTTTHNCDEFLP